MTHSPMTLRQIIQAGLKAHEPSTHTACGKPLRDSSGAAYSITLRYDGHASCRACRKITNVQFTGSANPTPKFGG